MRIALFDTETIGLENKLVYDLALGIYDTETKEIVKTESWAIQETLEIPNIQNIAFFGENVKILQQEGKYIPFQKAKEHFNSLLFLYGVTEITAFNIHFDINAINETLAYCNIGNKFLERYYDFFCLRELAMKTLARSIEYRTIATTNKWFTASGKYISTTAESMIKFITGDNQFKQNHSALDDVLCELKILQNVDIEKRLSNIAPAYIPPPKIDTE